MYYYLFLLLVIFINITPNHIEANENTNVLNTLNSTKINGIGGYNISIYDADLSLGTFNPALIDSNVNHQLVVNYTNYIADINSGYIAFAKSYGNHQHFSIGINYNSNGKFIETDEQGNKIGDFQVADYTLHLSWSRRLTANFLLGVRLKPMYFVLERYKYLAMASDVGISYHNKKLLISSGFVIRNLGGQLTTYYAQQKREIFPIEISLGLTKKLRYAPFRFSLTYRNLQKFNTIYPVISTTDDNDKISFSGKLMSHFITGMELIFGKNFYLSMGYNFQRRRELKVEEKPSLVGLSWGGGLKIRKFKIGYSYSQYHRAGNTNSFFISTTIPEL